MDHFFAEVEAYRPSHDRKNWVLPTLVDDMLTAVLTHLLKCYHPAASRVAGGNKFFNWQLSGSVYGYFSTVLHFLSDTNSSLALHWRFEPTVANHFISTFFIWFVATQPRLERKWKWGSWWKSFESCPKLSPDRRPSFQFVRGMLPPNELSLFLLLNI